MDASLVNTIIVGTQWEIISRACPDCEFPCPSLRGFEISMDEDAFHSLHHLSDSGTSDIAFLGSLVNVGF